jgi:hypothetical protein
MCRQSGCVLLVEAYVEREDDPVGAELSNPALHVRRISDGDAADDDSPHAKRE